MFGYIVMNKPEIKMKDFDGTEIKDIKQRISSQKIN